MDLHTNVATVFVYVWGHYKNAGVECDGAPEILVLRLDASENVNVFVVRSKDDIQDIRERSPLRGTPIAVLPPRQARSLAQKRFQIRAREL